ncbi:MAG: hypothetical protein IIC13_12350 [SAR324 cluster bacterium]|nr:hypothetical protein [SAR324 cluster bacterium]MCH8887372.1 hypothetical protein [SAR324 cluster bacterium]
MTGGQFLWTLIGFLAYIIILLFLFFYQPFLDLFTLVINGIQFDNIVFWVTVVTAIAGFCAFHWQAYLNHIVRQPNIERMVLTSLRGSVFTVIVLSGGATLQAVMLFAVHLLRNGYAMDRAFGDRLVAIVVLVIVTAVFCLIFWLLRVIRRHQQA